MKNKKEVLETSYILGILAVIFSQIPSFVLPGLAIGIIGIVFGKKYKESKLPLALSIVGVVFAAINIITLEILKIFMLLYYALEIILITL